MSPIALTPGAVTLSDWRAVWQGATPRLNLACHEAISQSAQAVARILAKGKPVYGINTGFGKLATVRIPDEQLEALQRNIVLSHAAGVGAPSPAGIVRLMMALKMTNLGRGASGVRPEVIALLEAMLAEAAEADSQGTPAP